MKLTTPRKAPQTAQALAEALQAAGWRPGAPAHVTEASRRIDAQVCHGLRCPLCRGRAITYHPYRRGNRYRVLAVCSLCPTETAPATEV